MTDVELSEAHRRIHDRVASLDARLAALARARRSETDDDEHDPEGETLSAQWSMLSGLLSAAQEELRQADAAMRRLEAGTYGICIRCGRPIPSVQLDARPFREVCVACANRR